MWRLAFSQGILLGSLGVWREPHLDGRRRGAQTHEGNIKYRIGGRRPIQNYQGRKGVPIVLKGRTCEVFEKEHGRLCMEP